MNVTAAARGSASSVLRGSLSVAATPPSWRPRSRGAYRRSRRPPRVRAPKAAPRALLHQRPRSRAGQRNWEVSSLAIARKRPEFHDHEESEPRGAVRGPAPISRRRVPYDDLARANDVARALPGRSTVYALVWPRISRTGHAGRGAADLRAEGGPRATL